MSLALTVVDSGYVYRCVWNSVGMTCISLMENMGNGHREEVAGQGRRWRDLSSDLPGVELHWSCILGLVPGFFSRSCSPSFSEVGHAYLPEDDLEFWSLLPIHLEFWDYRYMAQCPPLLEPRERIQGFMHTSQATDIHGQPNRLCLSQMDSCSWHYACLAMDSLSSNFSVSIS